MSAATSHAAPASPRRSGYRLTLLPRPDLVGRPDAASRVERHRRLAFGADAAVALAVWLPLTVLSHHSPLGSDAGLGRWVVTMLLPAAWIAVLAVRGCYRPAVLTGGPAQCLRVMVSAMVLLAFVLLAVPSQVLGWSADVVLAAMAAVGLGSGLSRRAIRGCLARRLPHGRGARRALVVGAPDPVARLVSRLHTSSAGGLVPVAAYLQLERDQIAVPVPDLLDAVDDLGVDTVVLTDPLDGAATLPDPELARALAARRVELLARRSSGCARGTRPAAACGTVRGALASVQSSRIAARRPR